MRVRAFAWKLAAAACVAALILPLSGGAQPLTPRGDGPPPYGEALAPRDIIASVRAAGFNPLSRPMQRGAVYVVFAVDRYFMDVRVMVDGRSGRVLSATRLAGVLYGGPGYGGYEVLPGAPPGYLPPYERPPRGSERVPLPLAEGPLYGAGRNLSAPAEPAPSIDVAKRSPLPPRTPLPRARPDDPATGAANEPPAAAQGKLNPSPPQPPTMVPVAPLEPAALAKPPPAPQPTMVPVAPLE